MFNCDRDQPFARLVDRKARKTYGTGTFSFHLTDSVTIVTQQPRCISGATWVDVEMQDVWLSPPLDKQVPPIEFNQDIGRWLQEHAVQTHMFIFARADDLAEV